ncbi:MAG: hypothetical protein H0X33_10620 [Taibaiella sp.]|nr:hypothetical protein [Taibaiella sp.]
MKNKILILFLILLSNNSTAQKKCCECILDSAYKIAKKTGDYKITDVAHKEKMYCILVDSINNLLVYKKIPSFLQRDCFDYSYYVLWPNEHSPISVRVELLNRIYNKEVLKYLICLNDISMKRKCSLLTDTIKHGGYITDRSLAEEIPYVNKSFYDLIVWRYSNLLNDGEIIEEKSR